MPMLNDNIGILNMSPTANPSALGPGTFMRSPSYPALHDFAMAVKDSRLEPILGGLADWSLHAAYNEPTTYGDKVRAALDVPIFGLPKFAAAGALGASGIAANMALRKGAGMLGPIARKQAGILGSLDDLTRLSKEQLEKFIDRAGHDLIRQQMSGVAKESYEPLENRLQSAIKALVVKKIESEAAANIGKKVPFFKNMIDAPIGTKIITQNQIDGTRRTGTIVSGKYIQFHDGIRFIPKVDYGEGRPKSAMGREIIEVFAPRSAD